MNKQNQIATLPFQKWILKEPENRLYLVLSVVFTIIAFCWLKWRFPYPNFLPDSYSYLDAAFKNQDINMWPIGYSWFLRLFSSFTRSDTALVFFQYLLLQAAILYFLFSIRYLLSPGKWLSRILFAFCIVSPLSLYASNFVSSDTLFAALSLLWFTQILWTIHQPRMRLLVLHAFVLVFVFAVRYNALYYPLISLAVIVMNPMPAKRKWIAAGSIILLVGGFIGNNLYRYRQLTGAAQFSAFGGWQLASNALFAFAHSTPDPTQEVPPKFRPLQTIVNRHMDSVGKLATRPDNQLGIYYLWDEHAPLKVYMRAKWEKDSVTDEFKKWATMGPVYSEYGAWLIRRHPADFIKYYIWPNMINYYAPNAEFMNIYNMGGDSIEDIAKFWFAYKSNKVNSRDKQIPFTNVYSILLPIVNLLFVLSLICFGLLRGFKRSPPYHSLVIKWFSVIWFANFGFSVLASPVVLRYQLFPFVITTVIVALLLEFLVRESSHTIQANSLINEYETYTNNTRSGELSRMQKF